MNFLAHLYLSGSSDTIRIGNFIGDFVKGKKYQDYPEQIAQGILLHREIDSYTDEHPVNQQLRKQLSPYFRHYSGVVLDVFWDHFLANNWETYSDMSLEDYTLNCYALMHRNRDILPAGVQRMLPYMEKDNWLLAYSTMEGVGRALTGLSHRTRYESNMEQGEEVLEKFYSLYLDGFTTFFPDLQQFVSQKNPAFLVT